MRITKPLPTECPNCRGIGYTIETSPEMHTRPLNEAVWQVNFRGVFVQVERYTGQDVEFATQYRNMVPQVGSGCPRCHGTGQLKRRAA